MASVSIKNVWKYYGETAAVKDLNLEVQNGEFLCVLGPSGCGKSSSLRMLAGLEHISAGDIHFGDRRVNDLPPKDRDIAMVFENYALYPHKTVFDNIGNALKLRKVDPTTIQQKVERAAEMLEIKHLLQRKPMELSGGQKQRVAIGRAIVREPELFLFDEPIAHLDAKLRAHMRGELKILQRKLGTTMVYVTHDQMEALALSDRVAVMANAVLQQFGDRNDLYHRPKNLFVADFIGEPATNFMKAQYSQNSTLKISGDLQFSLTSEISSELERKQMSEAVLGIRPQNLSLDPIEGENYIQGELVINEFLGERSILEIKSGETSYKVLTDPQKNIKKGDSLKIYYKKENVMIFHPETEDLI